jgi:hypothetical protein
LDLTYPTIREDVGKARRILEGEQNSLPMPAKCNWGRYALIKGLAFSFAISMWWARDESIQSERQYLGLVVHFPRECGFPALAN